MPDLMYAAFHQKIEVRCVLDIRDLPFDDPNAASLTATHRRIRLTVYIIYYHKQVIAGQHVGHTIGRGVLDIEVIIKRGIRTIVMEAIVLRIETLIYPAGQIPQSLPAA
jgi:hypothetical protein